MSLDIIWRFASVHRRLDMIDQSIQNLHTVVTVLGDTVQKLSALPVQA